MHLTKPQELIWDMERFAGGSVAVICTSMLRRGHKDEQVLQKAVDRLFCINDALRTKLNVNGEKVTQNVEEYTEQRAEVLYFPNTSALTDYAESYCQTAIDLSGPLCEMKILILPAQYGLLVKIHHLIADAWTMALLATQFNMIMEGNTPQAYSYQSYCEREANYHNSNRYVRDKQFFLTQIEQCKNPVFIREQTIGATAAGRETLLISPEKTAKIRDFAYKMNCSVFSLFATVLAVYISRINRNEEKLYIGTTVLNRMNQQEMHTAGMFVNTVPLLLSVNPNLGFLETLEETEDALMSVFRHQQYNYKDLLCDAHEEGRAEGRLFDVILNYMNAVVDGTQQETESTWYHNGIQNESLQIHLDDRDREGVLRVTYDYHVEKFTQDAIKKLHTHLLNLLFDGIDYPDKLSCKLNMLSPEEEQKIRFDFNNTAWAYSVPKGATIFSLFEENAKRNPDKICISIGDMQVSYGELLKYSEVIDSAIRSYTDDKKTVIAVIAERSVQMYSAIYGIIRGGNAYLPIPTDYPQDRINYMLESSGVSLVIAQEEFMHLSGQVSCINATALLADAPEAKETVPCAAAENDVAYVLYTSGTTGNPKGVTIRQQSVLNRILWMNAVYPLEDSGVILQKTPFGFDVSVWEIFWWGICGGSMVASKPAEHFLPEKVLEEVDRHHVTHLHFIPSALDLFLRYLECQESKKKHFRSVKHVFVSGEELDPVLVRRFYALFDCEKVKLHNLYGPTECTVDVTYYDCLPTDEQIPIGLPIYNTQIYITDNYLNLLPTGVKGELLIGGQNVGLGYINEPVLTKKHFIKDPFGEGTLYKTGDLAYRREDGQIIFCGRMDTQVKLNGQRIEIGEIESTIKSVPSVKNAAVVIRTVNGRPSLLAYYCGDAGMEDAIFKMCEKKLPGYMVPRQLVRLEQFPLNHNGKLDRNALKNLPIGLSCPGAPEPPADALEQQICDLFCAVLGQESVGRHSDFFALGGTSLSVISFLVESGYTHITPAQFMKNATPAKLAALIKASQKKQNQVVETLHVVQSSPKAYVFFPFAGGNAEAYVNLLQSIKNLEHDVSLYFVPFLHTEKECELAAEMLISHLAGQDVYFYAHCAGAAVALRVLQILEEKQQNFVKHFFIAASIPFKGVCAQNGWNYMSDGAINRILRMVGAPDDLRSSKGTAEKLQRFREDTSIAMQIFRTSQPRIECPITLLLGKKDLFTRFYINKEKHWKRYAHHIAHIYFLDTASHYFQADMSNEVARLILWDQ